MRPFRSVYAASLFLRCLATLTAVDEITEYPLTAGEPIGALTERGTVEAAKRVAVYARNGGFIHTIRAELGDHVTKGQILAELLVPELETTEQEDRALLAEANAKLEGAKSAATAAEAELQASGPKATDVAVRKAQVEVARAAVRVAQANCEVAKSQVRRIEIMLGYRVVRSPFDGIVSQKHCDVGALVLPATHPAATPLFVVQSTDPVRVTVEVPESYSALIQKATKALIQLDALPGEKFQGELTRHSGAISPSNRTMTVEIDLRNPDVKILPGMCAQVTLTLKSPTKSVVIPAGVKAP